MNRIVSLNSKFKLKVPNLGLSIERVSLTSLSRSETPGLPTRASDFSSRLLSTPHTCSSATRETRLRKHPCPTPPSYTSPGLLPGTSPSSPSFAPRLSHHRPLTYRPCTLQKLKEKSFVSSHAVSPAPAPITQSSGISQDPPLSAPSLPPIPQDLPKEET